MGSQSVGHDLVTVQQQRDGQRNRELRKRETDVAEIEGKRRREQQRMRWLGSIIDLMDMGFSKLWKMVKDRQADMLQSMGSQESYMTQ